MPSKLFANAARVSAYCSKVSFFTSSTYPPGVSAPGFRATPYQQHFHVANSRRNVAHILWAILEQVTHVSTKLTLPCCVQGEDTHYVLDRRQNLFFEKLKASVSGNVGPVCKVGGSQGGKAPWRSPPWHAF